ncbi:MAG TPA: MauE/DoxX family redox-associated membrane protein [Solirubrobacteraceae bacterium]|jgi:hypothetical protein|nr:MauE/DoxX family redox-associated membrane protein [Solirubrobacteraceae bacterium]
MTHVAYGLQLALGAVFLLSVVPKLQRPREFARTVANYKVISPARSRLVAPALIAAEAFLAVSLLTGWLAEAALALAVVLLLVFAAGVGVNLRRGRDISCGCFGERTERISPRTLVRLALILLAVGVVAAADGPPFTPASAHPGDATALEYALSAGGIGAGIAVLALWLLHLPELASVVRLRKEPAGVASATDAGPSLKVTRG